MAIIEMRTAGGKFAGRLALLCPLLCHTFLPVVLHSATYYVDFLGGADTNNGTSKSAPWQHVKGMVGCANACSTTTPAGGDTVVFKGGVTWTSGVFVWELVGGTSGSVTYTTDHTWYTGPSYSQPIFNPGGADTAGGEIRSDGSNFITLNDLEIINCGAQPNTVSSHYCLTFYNGSNISVTNCTFQPYDWISTLFEYTVAGSYSNLTFLGNDLSHTSNAIWIASTTANTSIHTVNISNNTFHDYHDNMIGGTHGNGLHYYGVPASDSTQYMDGVTFCNNRSYGDFTSSGPFSGTTGGAMTAFFFFESALSGVVCNNDFSFSPVQPNMFNSLMYLHRSNNGPIMTVQIYNNSLVNAGTNAMSAAINVQGAQAVDAIAIENNIFSNMQYCMYFQDSGSTAAVTSDYNLLNCSSGQNDYAGSFKTYAQWQALGYDAHSVIGANPSWMSAPGNESLSPGSPAIRAGLNLTALNISVLDSDFAGVARPGTGAWDVGSSQFVPAGRPSPPSGLAVTAR